MQIAREKNQNDLAITPNIADTKNTPVFNSGSSALDMIGLGWIFTDNNYDDDDYLTSCLANSKRRCNVIE